jgi:hypothetical protein
VRWIGGKEPGDQLVGIDKGSINKVLNRTMTSLGLKSKYPKTGEHSIRKLYAQTCWDNCRSRGMSVKQAKAYANEQLGHIQKHDDALLYIYVRDMS